MSTRISPNEYQIVINHAWAFVLAGGGVIPDRGASASELENTVSTIAKNYFDGLVAGETFERAIAGLEYEQREAILAAAWALVNAHQDAGFTFGAAVGLQLAGRHAETTPRVPKGGRGRGGRR